MKLKEYLKLLEEIVRESPQMLEYELVYATDEEGNSYKKVHNNACLCQIHDLKEYDLELIGFAGDENIAIEDCNAVIIN